MAVTVKDKKGKDVVLLNPSEKRDKYYNELKLDCLLTNTSVPKTAKDGTCRPLTDKQRAYRAGWLACQNEQSKIFRKKHPRYKRVGERN